MAKVPISGILEVASDWKVLADLDKRLVFPPHVVVTGLRPDLIIYSDQGKVMIMVELTCPCEQNFDARHVQKVDKYQDMKDRCIELGWKVYLFAVEVGARGYTAHSLSSCLRILGLRGRNLRRCLEEAGNTALRTSFWVWILRDNKEWK